MRFRNASLAAAAMTVGLFACSSSTTSPTPGNTQPVDDFIASLADASCQWEFRCCTDPEIKTLEGNKFSDQDACVKYRALSLQDQLYLDRLAVRENRLTVDAAKAASCIQQNQQKVCNPMPGQPAPMPDPMTAHDCDEVFAGVTPIGAECIYAKECVKGAHCVSDGQATGRGVCVPYQAEGDICNGDGDCDPSVTGLYCAQQDFKCHVRGKAGDACAYTTDASGSNPTLPMLLECDTSTSSSLYCDPSSKTCKELPGDGQSCLDPLPPGVVSRCNPDPTLMLVCSQNGVGGAGICRAPGKVGDDCSSIPCATDLYCDRSGAREVCATPPGLGQSCLNSGICAKPYFCNAAKNYTCDQPAQLGQDCSQVSCDTDLWCDRSTANETCKAKLADGSQCTQSIECLSLDCAGGPTPTCRPTQVVAQCRGR